LDLKSTFSVQSTIYSDTFTHSKFVSYRVKDAIVDYFMDKFQKRPSVSVTAPALTVHIHISQNRCSLALDSSGESLHKRGYRSSQTEAPINESLAAGMLLLAGWDGKSNFVDPMCGSGTLLIEAALIALNIPPGIYRKSFGFEKWKDFDKDLFDNLYNDDSYERDFHFKISGSDISSKAIQIAEQNIKSAGLGKYIELTTCPITEINLPQGKCLMVTNPPYGERLKSEDLFGLYETIGRTLKHKFSGSDAWLISSDEYCLQRIGLKPSEKFDLLNGELECKFCHYEIFDGKRNDFLKKQ
jgi:putative N6-adenine-specific DNA methylase